MLLITGRQTYTWNAIIIQDIWWRDYVDLVQWIARHNPLIDGQGYGWGKLTKMVRRRGLTSYRNQSAFDKIGTVVTFIPR